MLTDAASRQLPQWSRQRKPGLAALAVLLVLGGALTTMLLVMGAGERAAVIRVTGRVGAGQPFGPTVLQEARVADDGGTYWPWSQRGRLATAVASVTVLPGTLLTPAMVAGADGSTAAGHPVRLGLALKPGQAPYDLRRGEHVQLIHVPSRRNHAPEPDVVAEEAVVDGVTYTSGTATQATVIVDSVVAPQVASHAANGEIAIAAIRGNP
ncbi:hypothetical protein [Nonomuraea sp. NPDC049309]|uniref:hypothetical protein n=1 Tax=Nonomuraea sp. NPDC049309 TaxID=3364350 RepID=UPI003712D548